MSYVYDILKFILLLFKLLCARRHLEVRRHFGISSFYLYMGSGNRTQFTKLAQQVSFPAESPCQPIHNFQMTFSNILPESSPIYISSKLLKQKFNLNQQLLDVYYMSDLSVIWALSSKRKHVRRKKEKQITVSCLLGAGAVAQ